VDGMINRRHFWFCIVLLTGSALGVSKPHAIAFSGAAKKFPTSQSGNAEQNCSLAGRRTGAHDVA
jgi:hypothetical protein